MLESFKLHPQLEADTILIQELPLSKFLLMNDSRIPWFILVPRKNHITEIYQLETALQIQLLKEITMVSKWAQAVFKADKMNVAALGNVVSELHVHVIARSKKDFAWPKPVWGIGIKEDYLSESIDNIIEKAKSLFNYE